MLIVREVVLSANRHAIYDGGDINLLLKKSHTVKK